MQASTCSIVISPRATPDWLLTTPTRMPRVAQPVERLAGARDRPDPVRVAVVGEVVDQRAVAVEQHQLGQPRHQHIVPRADAVRRSPLSGRRRPAVVRCRPATETNPATVATSAAAAATRGTRLRAPPSSPAGALSGGDLQLDAGDELGVVADQVHRGRARSRCARGCAPRSAPSRRGSAVALPSTGAAVQLDDDPLARQEAGCRARSPCPPARPARPTPGPSCRARARPHPPGSPAGRSTARTSGRPGSPRPVTPPGVRVGRGRRRLRVRSGGRRRGRVHLRRGVDGLAVLLRGPGEAVVVELVDERDAGAVAGGVLQPPVDRLAPVDVVGAQDDGRRRARRSPRPRPPGDRVVASRTK